MKLSQRAVAALTLPPGKVDVVYWDDSLPGFGCRLRGDSRSWLIQYRAGPRQHREALGDVRKVTLDAARKVARQRFAQIELGVDPAAEKAKARVAAAATALTLGAVSERYLDAKRGALRHNSFRATRLHLLDHWKPLAGRPIGSIGRTDVAAMLQVLAKERGRIAAARSRTSLSALYAWALGEGLADGNPVIGTNAPDAGVAPRERVLIDRELAAIWNACDDSSGRIVRLLILTGCRRQEIGGLKWSEIDTDRGTITIDAARTKNHRALTLTLPPAALAILAAVARRGEAVFSHDEAFQSWSALKARIDASSGVSGWTLHDLRRTAATGMADIGVQPHVIEQILNHQSGHKRGPAGIYNRSSYDREVRAALALWADHVLAVVEGRAPKVLAFPAAAVDAE